MSPSSLHPQWRVYLQCVDQAVAEAQSIDLAGAGDSVEDVTRAAIPDSVHFVLSHVS
jgi:hypothetical protein